MMKFTEFDDLILNKVLMQPLSEEEFGGDESEYYNIHKDRIYRTLQVIPETSWMMLVCTSVFVIKTVR